MATSGLGIPVKLLHESLGHIITVELKTGQLYRGKLAEGDWLCDALQVSDLKLTNASLLFWIMQLRIILTFL